MLEVFDALSQSAASIPSPRVYRGRAMPEEFVFNPFIEGFDADPAPVYRELRTRAPVYFWPLADAYLISRYQDILALAKDPRLSRSNRDGARWQPLPDVPEYHEYRSATENGHSHSAFAITTGSAVKACLKILSKRFVC